MMLIKPFNDSVGAFSEVLLGPSEGILSLPKRKLNKAIMSYNIKVCLFNLATVGHIVSVASAVLGIMPVMNIVNAILFIAMRLFIAEALQDTFFGVAGNQSEDRRVFGGLFKGTLPFVN